MSRVTFSTYDDYAELRGPERHYAGWIVGQIAQALAPKDKALQMFPENDGDFCAQLNTAILIGNDTISLLARLHAQCEIHGYIEKANRKWYADLIEEGLKSRLLRQGMGWEGVVNLLHDTDDGPVVTSYSVTDCFPGREAASWAGYEEPRDDAWYEDFDDEGRWELAVKGIRAHGCEWRPEIWRVPNFGNGNTVLTSTEEG